MQQRCAVQMVVPSMRRIAQQWMMLLPHELKHLLLIPRPCRRWSRSPHHARRRIALLRVVAHDTSLFSSSPNDDFGIVLPSKKRSSKSFLSSLPTTRSKKGTTTLWWWWQKTKIPSSSSFSFLSVFLSRVVKCDDVSLFFFFQLERYKKRVNFFWMDFYISLFFWIFFCVISKP